jgi:hypothetical protein
MKNLVLVLATLLVAVTLIDCASLKGMNARVLKQTDTSAVIQGAGPTEFEAKENATQKAAEILAGEVKETQPPECTQEYKQSGHTSGTGTHKKFSSSGRSYHSCVLYFQKK